MLCLGGTSTTAHSPGGIRFSEIAISDQDVCGVDDLGLISCWGYQVKFSDERREDNMLVTSPPMGPRVVGISSWTLELCSLDMNGDLACFGGPHSMVPPKGKFGG